VKFIILIVLVVVAFGAFAASVVWTTRYATRSTGSTAKHIDVLVAQWNRPDSPGCSVGQRGAVATSMPMAL
jgi:flagellar basal body-associated protein FliL